MNPGGCVTSSTMSTKKTGNDTEADPKVVRDILDKLKSEGLFDQFRKECLADVDTKPAFQNLRQRVEGYVSRFLTRQVWSPNLNKNHLRDSLRRQINQSGMLATGVERVIEQVVNPKIFHVIKPKIDEVACKHLNIDPVQRKERMEQKKNQQKQNLQSLMSLSVPPPDFQQQPTSQQPTPLLPQSVTPFGSPPIMAGFPQTTNMWPLQTPPQQQSSVGTYPPGMMNFPMAMPMPLPYGMPPQAFPYMPNPWGGFAMPNIYTKPPGFDTPSSAGSDATVTSKNPPIPGVLGQFGASPAVAQSPLAMSSPSVSLNVSIADTPTPPKPSLPPLPPIPKTPPPPGTEETPTIPKEAPKPEVSTSLFKEEKNILEDIPLPAMPPTPKKKEEKPVKKSDTESVVSDMKTSGDESSQDLTMFTTTDSESMDTQFTYKEGDDASGRNTAQSKEEDGEAKRPYKFEWNREVDEMSELSVSSVHTSDLSLFSEGSSSSLMSDLSDDDIPAPCYSPHHGDEHSDEDQMDVEMKETKTDTSDVDAKPSTPVKVSPASSPRPVEEQTTPSKSKPESDMVVSQTPPTDTSTEAVTVSPKVTETADIAVPPKTTEASLPKDKESPKVVASSKVTEAVKEVSPTVATPGKPRRLISLQYNYSDSDDEETREERKARIAREKEERYVQRLQRRAELEARRKDREEEKAKLREERKKSKESKKEEDTDKSSQDVSKEEADVSVDTKMPESPEKKRKKTKAELKEELTKQKVQEKKEALRRQRTRTRRYTSDEFTSIYTEKKQPFSSQSYEELVVEEMAVEETVETVETDFTIGMMVDITPDIDLTQGQEVTSQGQEVTSQGQEVMSQGEEAGRKTNTDTVDLEESFESPATPTQDETANENQIAVNQDTTSIPIFEVVTSSAVSLSQSVHQTRSRSKISDDIVSSSSGCAASPTSDLSDKSDNVRRSGKRKRSDSGQRQSSVDTDTRGKRGRAHCSPSQSEDMPSNKSTDTEKPSSKRYDTSDLYKPHRTYRSSRRHASSPVQESSKSDKIKSSLDTSPISSRSTSPNSLIGQTSPISSSSASFSSSVSHTKSKSRSRSNSSSSSGSQHSGSSRSSAKKSVSGSSSSSVDEFGRRKRKNLKMPIDMVDFGEAARLAKSSLLNVDFGEAERWVQQQGKRSGRARGNQSRSGHPGRGGVTGRGQWHGPGPWGYPMEGPPGTSPPQSPQKHFYPFERQMSVEQSNSPHSSFTKEDSPPHGWQGSSPHRRGPRPESPPYPYPYRGRDTPPIPGYSRQRSESPVYRSGSPAAYRGMDSPPHYRSPSPPPRRPHTRSRMSQSPPPRPMGHIPRPISPDDCIETISSSSGSFEDPPSPVSPSHRPVLRGRRPPSPAPVKGQRSPSPPLHLAARGPSSPPSPPPLRQVGRRPRSPSPPHPALRGQRPPSPPPLSRGQVSPPVKEDVVPSTRSLRSQRPPSPPMMSQRLRNKHTAPDRFSPPPIQRETRRQRPPSPPPPTRFSGTKKAKR